MFAMAFMLWLISVVIELAIVNKVPLLYHLLERYTLVAIAFSFGLSVVVGTVFGAHGMIVMTAGMGSTITTMALYKYHFLENMRAFAKAVRTFCQQVKEIVAVVHSAVKKMQSGAHAVRHPIKHLKGVRP